jgi:hypothetical protein
MLVYFMDLWTILRPFGIIYCHLVVLLSFDTFYPNLVYGTQKNLATMGTRPFCLILMFLNIIVFNVDN